MVDTNETPVVRRRKVLAAIGTTAGVALAGCSSGDSENGGSDGSGDNTVSVGPNGNLVFEPRDITVSVGETVTWEFDSSSHNVSAWPEMNDQISIPSGATGFGTMEQGGNAFAVVDEGETFEHTFETAGEYTYVCVPHAASDMVGTVTVEE
ncbi:plastocyanin/azurin family copper-binding protein [Salinibaculum rarum]|uniref:plastocyanin/azurin family copper-binding protein n=1 Tax=Salinibaculum rarum TaxID=3058903 RepID=UPI00265E966D|nr:plastocyanin/azurin family copper-binding protein [Salinibaculum sp. KK48]